MRFGRISAVCAAVMTAFAAGSIYVSAASAEETGGARVWDGTADISWYTGDKDSYDISTPEQLAGLSELVRDSAHEKNFSGITINLTSDIILNDTSDWKNSGAEAPKNIWDPIGKSGDTAAGSFAGTFCGGGHTVSGLYTDSGEPAGLFCRVNGAVIRGVKLEKCRIVRNDNCLEPCGAIAGLSDGSRFEGCEAENVYISTRCYASVINIAAGGLVGEARGKTRLENCKAANVYAVASQDFGNPSVGGIIGAGEDVFAANCLSVNCSVSSVSTEISRERPTAACGAVIGAGTGEFTNCFSYNFMRTDGGSVQRDAGEVRAVTKEELISEAFCEALGGGYVFVDGNAPKAGNIKAEPAGLTSEVFGDVDGDGSVNVRDATALLKQVVAKAAAMDINGDGAVNVKDVTALLKMIAANAG